MTIWWWGELACLLGSSGRRLRKPKISKYILIFVIISKASERACQIVGSSTLQHVYTTTTWLHPGIHPGSGKGCPTEELSLFCPCLALANIEAEIISLTTTWIQESDYLVSGGKPVWTKLVHGRNLPVSSEYSSNNFPLRNRNTSHLFSRVANSFLPAFRARGLPRLSLGHPSQAG